MSLTELRNKYFIDSDDEFSTYKNYEIAIEKYFTYVIKLHSFATDIADGLVIDEEMCIGTIQMVDFFYSMGIEFKKTLGCDKDIIDPCETYSIRNEKFSINGTEGNTKIILNNAKTNIRLFARVFDFDLYEISQLALAIGMI